MDTIPGKLARIAEKLARARTQRATGFGVDSHEFRTNPPLRRDQVNSIEAQFGLSLPEDYRAFLLEIGDGGAGPYYGVPPLLTALEVSEDESVLHLHSEFPLADADSAADLPWTYEDLRCGSLRICDQGCAYQGRLVVLGEARGRIVYVAEDDSAPPHFVRDASFLDWYERWLDDLLADELSPWFGFDDETAAIPFDQPVLPEIPPGPFQEQLERVRRALWEAGDPRTVSGYRAPLDPAELNQLEQRLGIAFPADYRGFLQNVEAGGAGPYYGLIPIEFAVPTDDRLSRLSRPFPYTPASALAHGCPGVIPGMDERCPDGSIFLSHLGMGRYAYLIVTGESRGRVFYLDVDCPGCLPYFVRDANFLDWYERWLREGARMRWFGFDNDAYETNITGEPNQLQVGWKVRRVMT